MKTLQIKNITIGAGRPKIVVPIVAGNADEALTRADALARRRDIAVVELRIDALPPVRDPSTIAALSRQIYARLPQHIVLLIFRTQAEGGLRALTDPAYGDLYVILLREGQMDLLDVEMMREREIVTQLVSQAHRAGVGVVMSNHDFYATPPQAEIRPSTAPAAGFGRGHSKDCRNAAGRGRCAAPDERDLGNVFPLRRAAAAYDGHGEPRCRHPVGGGINGVRAHFRQSGRCLCAGAN